MIHDPLCWELDTSQIPAAAGVEGWPCVCDFIAKVRADEKEQAFNRASRFLQNNYPAGVFMTAAQFAAHAIRDTPLDELPVFLRRGLEE